MGNVSAKCSFITTSYNLFDVAEGNTVLMDEGGNVAEFIVAKHNYESELNGAGRTLLVRKHYAAIMAWNSTWSTYASSDVSSWLNGDYFNSFSYAQKQAINKTTIYYTPGFSDSYCNSGSSRVSTMAKVFSFFPNMSLDTTRKVLMPRIGQLAARAISTTKALHCRMHPKS